MVITTTFRAIPLALTGDTATEFASPNDECIVQHAALFQVFDQRRTRLVGIATARGAPAFQAAVVIPVRVEQLDEAHPALGEATRENAIGGIASRTA